jgi:ACS family glucarate transporter-like MFS transporter
MTEPSRAPEEVRPTRVRYGVIAFAVALAIITYFDRVTLSKAQSLISRDLHLTKQQMGWVFAAFAASYALMEIPSGYMGDRLGPRRVLMRIVIWWSAFTALMGFAFNFASLFVTQLFFGAGEAGCFPNITKAFTTWLPREERVRGQGIIWLAARWGGAVTPLIVFQLLRFVTWRKVFMIFGCVGIFWAVLFYRWYRDNPRDNPNLNQAERDLLRGNQGLAGAHGDVPWGLFATSPDILMLCFAYFFMSFSWYFYITWLPTFLDDLKLAPAMASALNILPLFLGGIGALLSGFLAAPFTRYFGSVRKARRVVSATSFLCAGALLMISTEIHEPWIKMIVIGMASFFNDVVLPPAWGACMDVGGKFSGTLSGAMNMTGNFGGVLFPIVAAAVLTRFANNWNIVFYLCTISYVVAAVLWMILDPVTPVEKPEPVSHLVG